MRQVVLLVTLLAGAAAAPAEDRALLIWVPLGFDAMKGVPPDIEAMRFLLEQAYGLAPGQIVELSRCGKSAEVGMHSRCPCSRQSILAALEELTTSTAPGDRLLIYWSGHGTRRSSEGRKPEEDDECDEVLVTCDFDLKSGAGGIVDDELGAAFERLSDRKLVVIIDACFSGGATKNIDGEWVPIDYAAVDSLPAKFVQNFCEKDGKQRTGQASEPTPPYVALLSSGKWQESKYRMFPERGARSLFTMELVAAHCNASADDNHDGVLSFAEAIRFAKKNLAAGQDPELRGPATTLNEPFFFAHQPRLFPVVTGITGDSVTISHGKVSGLDGRFIEYEVVQGESASAGAVIRVDKDQIGWRESKGRLVSGAAIKPGDCLRPRTLNPAYAPLTLGAVKGDSELANKDLVRIVDASPGLSLAPEATIAEIHVRLRRAENQWVAQVLDAGGVVVGNSEPGSREAAAAAVEKLLRGQIAVRALRHVAAAPQNQRQIIRKFEIAGGNRPLIAGTGIGAPAIRFEIELTRACFVTLLSIDPMGEVTAEFGTFEMAAATPQLFPPAGAGPLYVTPPAGFDHVFAIASFEPILARDVAGILMDRNLPAAVTSDLLEKLNRATPWAVAELVVESYERAK